LIDVKLKYILFFVPIIKNILFTTFRPLTIVFYGKEIKRVKEYKFVEKRKSVYFKKKI